MRAYAYVCIFLCAFKKGQNVIRTKKRVVISVEESEQYLRNRTSGFKRLVGVLAY